MGVEVLDADPESKGTFKVKLAAPVQPIMPEAPAGFRSCRWSSTA